MEEQDESLENPSQAPGDSQVDNGSDEQQVQAFDQERADLQALDDLRIGAQLRIGTMLLPLRNILNMKVGEVLPLDRPLDAPVQVLAGGRAIATGELVASNGFYAVRIKEVSMLSRHLPVDSPVY